VPPGQSNHMRTKKDMRIQRRHRIRSKVSGTSARPRLAVFKSNKYLLVQLINDDKAVTIGSVRIAGISTLKAKELGVKIVELAKKKGIKTLVFDRGGYRYHGVVKMIADTVREGGLTV
jgi:large subunit ribosomal protein L18